MDDGNTFEKEVNTIGDAEVTIKVIDEGVVLDEAMEYVSDYLRRYGALSLINLLKDKTQ